MADNPPDPHLLCFWLSPRLAECNSGSRALCAAKRISAVKSSSWFIQVKKQFLIHPPRAKCIKAKCIRADSDSPTDSYSPPTDPDSPTDSDSPADSDSPLTDSLPASEAGDGDVPPALAAACDLGSDRSPECWPRSLAQEGLGKRQFAQASSLQACRNPERQGQRWIIREFGSHCSRTLGGSQPPPNCPPYKANGPHKAMNIELCHEGRDLVRLCYFGSA
eukprot:1159633-Pelagomonas_calceolata.AAC.1